MSKKLTGAEMRKIRTKAGIGQDDFALLLGFKSYGWVSAMENGKAKINKRTEERVRNLQEKKLI